MNPHPKTMIYSTRTKRPPTAQPRSRVRADKRTAERLRMRLPIKYCILPTQDRTLIGRAYTTSLSGRGLSFQVPWRIHRGTACRVIIQLPNSPEALTFEGTVTRCTKPGTAPLNTPFTLALEISHALEDAAFAQYCHFVATQVLTKYLPK